MKKDRDSTAQCKLFNHQFDGHIFQENWDRGTVWVARLQCTRCDSWRTDVMVPETFELISRSYDRPSTYDVDMTRAEAKKIFFTPRWG